MSDTLPNPASSNTTRFESAPDPDGTLIPIPSAAPPGRPIRDDATVTVNPRGPNGYYVSIYNGPANPPDETTSAIADLTTDAAWEVIQHAVLAGAPVALEFGLSIVGVLASVFTTSPVLTEYVYRGTMDDGTAVTYVVMTPKNG